MTENKQEVEGLLVPVEQYLEAGIHVGTKLKNGDTNQYIYKKRKDGIYVLDITKINDGIKNILKVIKEYDNEDIVLVATRTYTENAAKKMKKFIKGINIITKRFIPGTFTNIESTHFVEPKIVIVCDPRSEKEAIREADYLGIKVIGLVDTDNLTKGIDYVIPINNKGRKSLALFFWILARELSLKQGNIKNYSEFKIPLSYFEKLDMES